MMTPIELAAVHEAEDLAAKIRFLLDTYHLWSEDGFFAFPDGDIWEQCGDRLQASGMPPEVD